MEGRVAPSVKDTHTQQHLPFYSKVATDASRSIFLSLSIPAISWFYLLVSAKYYLHTKSISLFISFHSFRFSFFFLSFVSLVYLNFLSFSVFFPSFLLFLLFLSLVYLYFLSFVLHSFFFLCVLKPWHWIDLDVVVKFHCKLIQWTC